MMQCYDFKRPVTFGVSVSITAMDGDLIIIMKLCDMQALMLHLMV